MQFERFSAYTGGEPHIFVSYARCDSKRVYAIIDALHDEGYRIWYDEGKTGGDDWRGVVYEHIVNCELFMVFLTLRAIETADVVKECTYATSLHKQLHVIYLDEVEPELIEETSCAGLLRTSGVHRAELSDENFNWLLRSPLGAYRRMADEKEEGA